MRDLSIIIPARNEMFLARTIEDILSNIEMDTEIIAVLDGTWADPPILDNPRITIIHHSESIGQRVATNEGAKISRGKYIMKCDAHCAFDKGFDRKMIELMQPKYTMVPVMRNLHAFNWVCPDGHTRYQGPSGVCQDCGKETTRDVVWNPKTNPQSTAYRFDKTMHFQYWNDFGRAQKGDLTESLCIQGSCFMVTREKYFELDICSEEFYSWGQQGVEVACKTWLSGGRVVINRTTWYAHMFRTQGGDFGFPYPQQESKVQKNRELSREMFIQDRWDKAIHPFSWLLEKFNPPEWDLEINKSKIAHGKDETKSEARKTTPSKGILYYTDNHLNMRLALKVRRQIAKSNLPITSVTLKPTDFGKNIFLRLERSHTTMFKQILAGLESMTEDIVYFAEHDVFYHPNHYEFTPTKPNKFYYNGNYWFVRKKDGFAIHYDVSPLSGLVGFRKQLLKHFKERVKLIEKIGYSGHMGFEPMTHNRINWKTKYGFEVFLPKYPNVDIAHEGNSTWKRWKQKDFLKKPKFWVEGTIDTIPGWDNNLLKSIL